MVKKKKENWLEENAILITILAFFVLVILIGIFSSGNNALEQKEILKENKEEVSLEKSKEEISLKEALSLCYKKAEECTEKETSSETEAYYYESALKQNCLQFYSAYSLSAGESMIMENSEVKEFEIEGSETIQRFTEGLC